DSETSVTILGPGNVTLTKVDALDRTLETQQLLHAGGAGDGAYMGVDGDGIPVSLPSGYLDTSEAGDGIISTYFAWDDNSNLLARRDDNGSVVGYIYNNLDQQVNERDGLQETGTTI